MSSSRRKSSRRIVKPKAMVESLQPGFDQRELKHAIAASLGQNIVNTEFDKIARNSREKISNQAKKQRDKLELRKKKRRRSSINTSASNNSKETESKSTKPDKRRKRSKRTKSKRNKPGKRTNNFRGIRDKKNPDPRIIANRNFYISPVDGTNSSEIVGPSRDCPRCGSYNTAYVSVSVATSDKPRRKCLTCIRSYSCSTTRSHRSVEIANDNQVIGDDEDDEDDGISSSSSRSSRSNSSNSSPISPISSSSPIGSSPITSPTSTSSPT